MIVNNSLVVLLYTKISMFPRTEESSTAHDVRKKRTIFTQSKSKSDCHCHDSSPFVLFTTCCAIEVDITLRWLLQRNKSIRMSKVTMETRTSFGWTLSSLRFDWFEEKCCGETFSFVWRQLKLPSATLLLSANWSTFNFQVPPGHLITPAKVALV